MTAERRNMSERVKGIGIGSILTTLFGSFLLGSFTYLGGQTLQIPVMQEQNKQLVENISLLNTSVKNFISHHDEERTDWKIWRTTIDIHVLQYEKQLNDALLGIEMVNIKCNINERTIEECQKILKSQKEW